MNLEEFARRLTAQGRCLTTRGPSLSRPRNREELTRRLTSQGLRVTTRAYPTGETYLYVETEKPVPAFTPDDESDFPQ